MKHLIIFLFIITYIFFGLELGYTPASPWWTHITYNFQHANIMHLIINSISFFYIFRALERAIPFRTHWREFATCALMPLTIATVASFFTPYPPRWLINTLSIHQGLTPPLPEGGGGRFVVGASGMIYVMIGIYLHILFKAGAFKNIHKRQSWHAKSPLWGVGGLTIFLTISLFKQNSAGMLHLLCLIAGFTGQAISKSLKKVRAHLRVRPE